MSYHSALGTESVTDTTTPPPSPFDSFSAIFSPPPPPKQTPLTSQGWGAPAPAKASGGGGFWDTLKSALVGGATAYGSGLAQKNQQQPTYTLQPTSPMSGMLPYVLLGGAAIVAVVLIKKKK
jgi:hypothetical protein